MCLKRLLLLCGLGFFLAQGAFGQTDSPAAAAPFSPAPSAPSAAESLPQTASPAHVAKPAGPQITFNSVYVDGPYIAFTFDDGPSATLTPKLLDLLAARKIKATFFVVGQNAAEYPAIVARAAREGHEIANHSWSHPNLGKMSDEAVRRELQKTDDAIKAATGVRPTLMRPPYGSLNARQKAWIHDTLGYRIIIWDVDPLDWKRPGPAVVTSRILKETRPGSIILDHDIHPPTIESLPATFEQLQAKGFKFVTVSELLALARPAPPKPVVVPSPERHPATAKSPAPPTANP
ncbi:MAG TPA: polysaccharide deacetylase family protein [Chthoniobacterales bacterium]|nr:polysaccharide deacetylase family protein [Chthoniobacterales bacterium]